MSTKTILKKIAVVAVAALAFGGVSAVTASATTAPVINANLDPAAGAPGTVVSVDVTGIQTGAGKSTYVTMQYYRNGGGGFGFNNGIGNVFAAPTTVTGATSLQFTVPAGTVPGTYRVRVVANDGASSDGVSNYKNFSVLGRSAAGFCAVDADPTTVDNGVWTLSNIAAYSDPTQLTSIPSGGLGTDCVGKSTVYGTAPQSATGAVVLTAVKDANVTLADTDWVVTASGANSIIGITGGDFANAGGVYTMSSLSGVLNGDTIGVSTANLGVTTIKYWKRVYTSAFTYSDTAVQTFIVNVSNQSTTYVGTVVNGDSTSILSSAAKFEALAGTTVADDSNAIFAPKGSSGTFSAAARFYVHQLDSAGGKLGPTSTKAITVTLSGVGSVALNGDTPNGGSVAYVALGAGNGNDTPIYLWADGRSGVSTLTISVNGVVVATKSVNFYGTVASLTPTPVRNYIKNGNVYTGAVSAVVAKDASGTVVPVASGAIAVTATGTSVSYTDTTLNSGAVSGSFESHVGVRTTPLSKSGDKTTLTASYALADGTFVTSPSWVVTLGGSVASIVGAFDQASYALGAPFKLTYTLKDSSGNIPADNPSSGCDYSLQNNGAWSYNNYPTFAISTQNQEWILCVDGPVAGVATVSGFAPQTQGNGTWTIKYTDMDGATVRTISAALEQDAATAAAADAAAEATDAANAATDAANAAAEAADAATAAAQDAADAVAALAAQVSTMISALKKQLIALTNLVIKIQKKVKA